MVFYTLKKFNCEEELSDRGQSKFWLHFTFIKFVFAYFCKIRLQISAWLSQPVILTLFLDIFLTLFKLRDCISPPHHHPDRWQPFFLFDIFCELGNIEKPNFVQIYLRNLKHTTTSSL